MNGQFFTALENVAQQAFPGSRLLNAWTLSGGISAAMTALEIELPDGSAIRAIYRQPGENTFRFHPHAAEDEFKVLAFLREQNIRAPIPLYLVPGEVVAHDSGSVKPGEAMTARGLLIEYIPGEPDYLPLDAAAASRQMAEYLARLHTADCSLPELSFLARQAACEELNWAWEAETAQTLENYQLARAPDGTTLLDVAVRLNTACDMPTRNPPALLHGDFWPGNLLWQAGQLVAVVDWEDAHIGDALSDLAIARLDMLYSFGAEAVSVFTAHYQACNPVDITALPYWDLCAALRLARMVGNGLENWASFFHDYGRMDISAKSITDCFWSFTQQALHHIR